ncbi:hypothetical protein PIB30_040501 [Stylosanthes scabra]|uniref:RRM domain-containing protein n=1 Tax=Stylosanthes scabra TaxID=79078 RepID=A0ABU6QFC9_9FABA|nr:hypothetical protein [Stylosanthes scabra]
MITKRELYKEFGLDGYINDIYISRRKRRQNDDTFAFVRFSEYGGMMKAITRMNGGYWKEHKLSVSRAKWGREGEPGRTDHAQRPQLIQGANVNTNAKQTFTLSKKKEVKGVWSMEQKKRMKRSLLGVCVEPVDFRKVMNRLLDEWNGPGDIESHDVGPYRCLVTFSSLEIRDEAMKDELLLSTFDEVRPLWEFVWGFR